MCWGYPRKKRSGWMKRQMVRREEDPNPNVTYGPCMHACAPPWPSLHAVLKLSKITYNWWLSEQLPGAHKALRPRPWNRPSTHASCHPSIFTEGLSDHGDLRSANYAGSRVAESLKWCLVQTSITNVFNHYWLVATLCVHNLLSVRFGLWSMWWVWTEPALSSSVDCCRSEAC